MYIVAWPPATQRKEKRFLKDAVGKCTLTQLTLCIRKKCLSPQAPRSYPDPLTVSTQHSAPQESIEAAAHG